MNGKMPLLWRRNREREKSLYGNEGDYCVIIHDIPTDICSQCGEAYYDPEQGKAIEQILKTLDAQVKRLQTLVLPANP